MDGFDPGWDDEDNSGIGESAPEKTNSLDRSVSQKLASVASSGGAVQKRTAEEMPSSGGTPWCGGLFGKWLALPGPRSVDLRLPVPTMSGKRARSPTADPWKALAVAVPEALVPNDGGACSRPSEARSREDILAATIRKVRACQVDTRGLVQGAMCLIPKEAAVIVIDLPSCVIKHAGKGFEDIGRWLSDGELTGYHFTTLLHPEDAMRFKSFAVEVLRDTQGGRSQCPPGRSQRVQVGKTQSLRLIRRLPESGSPEQCASRWALTYTKPLELRVAEVESLEDGGAVVVFLADLRLADELGFNYSSQVDQVTTLINQEKINCEYIFDWSKGGMDVFAFVMTYAGWGLGSDRVLGQNSGWVQFANAFQRTVSVIAKWLLKKVLTHKLSTFWVFDDQGQPHVVHYGNMRFVGGGGYTRVEKTALGKTEEAVPPPQIASSSIDAVLLGSAGEKTRGGTPVSLSPSGGSSVVQPRRHQIVYMILDPAKEPEDESICAMAISIPAPGSTRTSAEIRVMSTWTATSANIRSDMPWASGSTNEDSVIGEGSVTGLTTMADMTMRMKEIRGLRHGIDLPESSVFERGIWSVN